MPCADRRWEVRCHISWAFAWTSSWGISTSASLDHGVHGGLRGTRSRSLRSSASRDALADLLAQLVERVVAAGLDGELVVQLGQPLLLDLLDLDRELGVLAGQVLGRVVVGEGDVATVRSSPAAPPSSCSSKPGTSRPDPSSSRKPRRLAALEGLAVDAAGEVDHHVVAVGGLALHGLERGERLAHALELGLHLVRVDLRLAAADLDARRSRRAWPAAHADLDREGERGALLGQVARCPPCGSADGGDARRRCTASSYQPGSAAAHRLVEHAPRGPPAGARPAPAPCRLRKPGTFMLAPDLARRRCATSRSMRVARDLHLHAHARVAELRGGGLHGGRHRGADDSVRPCALASARVPIERLQAWLVTGPPGHSGAWWRTWPCSGVAVELRSAHAGRRRQAPQQRGGSGSWRLARSPRASGCAAARHARGDRRPSGSRCGRSRRGCDPVAALQRAGEPQRRRELAAVAQHLPVARAHVLDADRGPVEPDGVTAHDRRWARAGRSVPSRSIR